MICHISRRSMVSATGGFGGWTIGTWGWETEGLTTGFYWIWLCGLIVEGFWTSTFYSY
jgi:hypothetical protein